MRHMKLQNGYYADLSNEDRWKIRLLQAGKIVSYTLKWDRFPIPHIENLKENFRATLRSKHPTVATNGYNAMSKLYSYLALSGKEELYYCKLTETEWGDFDEFLKMQCIGKGERTLSLSTRRNIFESLKALMKVAIIENLGNVTFEDLETIERGSRRRFRDYRLLCSQRAAKLSLTEQEADHFYAIISAERRAWINWKEERRKGKPPDLLAAAAAWLAVDEGIRPEEINVLSVKDIIVDDEKYKLHLNASNKKEDIIQIHEKTYQFLRLVVDWGVEARSLLGTDHLFVSPVPKPRVITSKHLNSRIRTLLRKYRHIYPLERPDLILASLRKTLGASLGSSGRDIEEVRRIMRHEDSATTKTYYINQNKAQLSKSIAETLGPYMSHLAKIYYQSLTTHGEENDE